MEKIELPITTEYIKLDQLLKFSGMAESGADYQTILTHYYTGVTVEVFTG